MHINLKDIVSDENNNIKCFIAIYDGLVYLIPEIYRDIFESTHYDNREDEFKNFILPYECIIDCHIDTTDFEYFMDGGFDI